LAKTPWWLPQLGILSPVSVSSVSLLGTGWLGLPLGKALHTAGYTVHAATTQEGKLPLLAKEGFTPHLVEVGREAPAHVSDGIERAAPFHTRLPCSAEPSGVGVGIWHSDTLIVTLPFRRNFTDPWIYVDQMRDIVAQLSPHQRVLLTSSTAYYPDCDHDVDEGLAFSLIAPRLKALAAAEAVIMSHHGPSAVLRLGGLYGPDRQIGSFAKRGLEKRSINSRVNLIHRDDVIGIVLRMLNANVGWGTILNAVSDGHPTRGVVYGSEHPPLPPLSKEKNSTPTSGKIVSNHKLKMALDYQFCYPEPLASVEDFLQ